MNNENAPQKAGEEFGPLCLFNIQKKGTGKNPIPLLSVGYRKDDFYVFVDRVELSEDFNEIVRVAHDEIKPTVFDEIFGYAENEIKSTHRRSDFIR